MVSLHVTLITETPKVITPTNATIKITYVLLISVKISTETKKPLTETDFKSNET